MSSTNSVSLEDFDASIMANFIEVSSSAIGGKVLSCSDDFFASKDNLIKPTPSLSMKGQFGPNGALYDGWESRRHNPSFDWVIILLAPKLSTLHYVDIDTSHFSGNEAPASSVFGLHLDSPSSSTRLSPSDPRWHQILPVTTLGPNSRHVFELGDEAKKGHWSALMVRMIPDGGMARFRAYGHPLPPVSFTSVPPFDTEPINLLSPLLSGRIVACSDANFSPPHHLLLPGRGFDMSDGWETRRSQVARGKYAKGGVLDGQERKEWVIGKLAAKGVIRYFEVDSAYHVGNYPMACMIEGTLCEEDLPPATADWTPLVSKKPLGPHRQHWFDIERSVSPKQLFSHVRLSIYPDGGLKRFRVFGHPISSAPSCDIVEDLTIHALPITPETFSPYGQVIQGFSLPTSAPKGTSVNIANQGTAYKFHRMAKIKETYPEGLLEKGGLMIGSVRANPHHSIKDGKTITVTTLERHAHTSQAFIPMGKDSAPGVEPLSSGGAYIVVAALNGKDDKPDLATLRAFLVTASQGVSFDEGIWHHSLLTVDGPLDYAIVEAQIGEPGNILDVEFHTPSKPIAKVQIPPYTAASPSRTAARSKVSSSSTMETLTHLLPSLSTHTSIHHPVPITSALFAPFGNIIQANPVLAPQIEVANSKDGKTTKWSRLAPVTDLYPEGSGAVAGIAVFRATKKVGLERGKVFDVRLMERHPFTSQAFIPMGKAEWKGKGEEVLERGGQFLVIVAKGGPDDKPDPSTLKTFIMHSNTGLNYAPGVWHHPVLILDTTLDLACVESQISTNSQEPDARDCELLQWDGEEVFGRIAVPDL
ncbi:allantoicase, partial [Tremellales sp. Uapishka_1]